MNNNSAIQMIYFFDDFFFLDDTIHDKACEFFEKYSVYPNLMLASAVVWNKVEEYAKLLNPENITFSETIIDNDNSDSIQSISSLVTSSYSIDFCLDDETRNDNSFILIFDDNPVFNCDAGDHSANTDRVIYKKLC